MAKSRYLCSLCFDPATNSLAISTKSMLSVKCLCSCLERSLNYRSLAKFSIGEEEWAWLVRFSYIHDRSGFQREYFEKAINKTTYKRFSLNNNEFSRGNALLISVNVYIWSSARIPQLTTDRVCSCHFKNDIRCRHQKMAFSLNEVLKLIIDWFWQIHWTKSS